MDNQDKLSGLKLFHKLSTCGRLLVFTFWPSELELFFSRIYRKYDLFFPKRNRFGSYFRRKFPLRGSPSLKVEIDFLPESFSLPEEGIKVIISPTVLSLSSISAFRETVVLFPYSFEFSCSFFGNPCSTPELAVSTIWEGGTCYRNCYGLWELFFWKNWPYYAKNMRKCSFKNFFLNGNRLKSAERVFSLLKESILKTKVLRLFSGEEILFIPVGNNLVVKVMEMDTRPVLMEIMQASLDAEAVFLGQKFSHEFIPYRSILKWKEEKNAYLPEHLVSYLRSRSLL